MRIDLVGYLFILPLPHSWCIHIPGIFVCLFIFVFLYIVYSVLHHSETNNHRDTTSWPFQSISCNRQIQIKPQKTETDIRCMCTLKLCYIFHADISRLLWLPLLRHIYPSGPHFSRPWCNATTCCNNQKGTLTNARSMICALCDQSCTFIWLISEIVNPW